MQIQEILTAAIVAMPVAYAAVLAVQFATGLTRLGKRPSATATASIAPVEPQTFDTDHIANPIQMETQEDATDTAAEVTPEDVWSGWLHTTAALHRSVSKPSWLNQED